MGEDQLTLLKLDLRPIPDPLKSGAIFKHVQRSPPTFPTMPLHCRSFYDHCRSIHVYSRLVPIFKSAIAQIGPLSFQAAIEHNTRQVRWAQLHASVVTEWSPACLHKQFPRDHHRGNYRKPQMEDVHNLINIGPTNPIQILNQHDIFWRFCMCPSNDTFAKNKKSWSRYWSSTAKTGSLLGIKQT